MGYLSSSLVDAQGQVVTGMIVSVVVTTTLMALVLGRWFVTTTLWSQSTLTTPKHSRNKNGVLLIVDGCNGPIRLNLNAAACQTTKNKINTEMSFLRVENGENKGDRIDLVDQLIELLRQTTTTEEGNSHLLFDRATVYFDGLGVKKQLAKIPAVCDHVEQQRWVVSSQIDVQITSTKEEADDVIVKEVQRRNIASHDGPKTTLLDFDEFTKGLSNFSSSDASTTTTTTDDDDDAYHRRNRLVYLIRRKSCGAGRSRQHIKRYDLMRPDSVFCLFGLSPPIHLRRDAKRLEAVRHLLTYSVEKRRLLQQTTDDNDDEMRSSKETIVATDDIFLRQRIVAAGGHVMTFEQLWELLSPPQPP